MSIRLLLLLLPVGGVLFAGEPTAEDILERYAEVSGRPDARSLYTRFAIATEGDAPPLRLEVWQAHPNRRLEVISQGGQVVVKTGSDGDSIWQWRPEAGTVTLDEGDRERLRYLALFRPLLRWRHVFTNVELLGREEIGGSTAHCLRLGTDWTAPRRYCFRVDDGLLQAMFEPLGRGHVSRYYADYRDFDGLQLPTRIMVVAGDGELRLHLVEAAVDPDIAADRFATPE